MEISQKHLGDSTLLQRAFSKHVQSLSEQPAATLLDFYSALMSYFPLADWEGRPAADLFNAVLDFYSFMEQRKQGDILVRTYNPKLDENGWVCSGTAVLFCCDDKPFLMDSVRMVLEQHELAIRVSKSTILTCQRNKKSMLESLALASVQNKHGDARKGKETFAYFEVTSVTDPAEREKISASVVNAIEHVTRVVMDYDPMLQKLQHCIDDLSALPDTQETVEFLSWLRSSNFTFLGYRELDFDEPVKQGQATDGRCLIENGDKKLGIFNAIDAPSLAIKSDDFAYGAREFYAQDALICFSKSRTRSTVHRHVYPDYVVIKKFNKEHQICGEHRFLGFYTYAVSSMSPRDIPILRKKMQYVVDRSGLNPASHDGKRLLRHIDLHPKDELFQATNEELYDCFRKVVALNERDIIRLVVRSDPFEQFVSCLVYVPKDLYSTSLRLKIQALIGKELDSNDVDATTFVSESKHARAHIVFRLPDERQVTLNVDELEREVIEIAHGWQEHFQRALDEHFGDDLGSRYFKMYNAGVPKSYQENFDARAAVHDIDVFESIGDDLPIAMQLYRSPGLKKGELKFRIIHSEVMLELSDVIPILENLGLRVLGEQPFKIQRADGACYWLHDFHLRISEKVTFDLNDVKQDFECAFAEIWKKNCESDGFNQLILAAGLNWKKVNLLRAYANYMKQTLFLLSLEYIAETLVSHTDTTIKLIKLFALLFDPENGLSLSARVDAANAMVSEVEYDLESVQVLNQDKVFRRYLDLIKATIRSNFYQQVNVAKSTPYIVLKFRPETIADIPEPKPAFEFFVYSARVEGAHLRTSKVARGGLRWSDRQEDYRTEVLGLVKAQQVKNSVIVPSGAKGGFVCKQMPLTGDRGVLQSEGIECYKLFIRGLLDLTDKVHSGELHSPEGVICHDDSDAYLVVAADKGTATFSDIANSISIEKKHWLGDAFASGGSQGYDHKAMGITAKGAWVSVQRHFREKGLNTQTDNFTVIGIGDMGGDVFGNGMLLSESIQLVAAFNHLHIFVDPKPDPQKSFQERLRLFNTPGTGWADYDTTLISAGGGVFNRSDKFVKLSKEIKAFFDIKETRMTPAEFIAVLLKAPVALIWNGGIGTYVKGDQEVHADVGDKANDILRVNGSELRCQVFGEGGNLGLTQRGRVDFALNNGACNTDFIDNAAGVDCSDHEVNIKILLDEQVGNGDLTVKQRNNLLEKMTEDVSALVLKNNYSQTLALSIAEYQMPQRMNEYRRFISYLEGQNRLDRELEFLPSNDELIERVGKGQSLTRPELSVLICYAKVQLKELLVDTNLSEDKFCAQAIYRLFPKQLHKKYKQAIAEHKLRKEIIATQLANDFINNLGITAYQRLSETTGSSAEEVIKAYVTAKSVFRLNEFVEYISALDYRMSVDQQYELMAIMMRRVRRATRWFLKNRRGGLEVEDEVLAFSKKLGCAQGHTGDFLPEQQREEWAQRCQGFSDLGIDAEWLPVMTMPENLFSGLGIVEVSNCCSSDIKLATETFVSLMYALKLHWFASQLSEMSVENYWQANARETYIDDLEAQLRKLSVLLINSGKSMRVEDRLTSWMEEKAGMIERWFSMIAKVESSSRTDYAMFAVALRELNDLVQVTEHR